MALNTNRPKLFDFIASGIVRKLTGRDLGQGRVLVVENSKLGFDLGPLLARVLRLPYFDARTTVVLPSGRCVISSENDKIAHGQIIDLQGRFGDYLLEEMTGRVDLRIEALKLSMQQLARDKGRRI